VDVVFRRGDGEVVADYTQLKGKYGTKKSWGNEYRSLKSIKRNAKRKVLKSLVLKINSFNTL
jgi:hypothetical protein